MLCYDVINPSDATTFLAPDREVALAEGRADRRDRDSRVGGQAEWADVMNASTIAVAKALAIAGDMAASGDPRRAAEGRLYRTIVEAGQQWLADEVMRAKSRDDIRDAVTVAVGGAALLVTSVLHSVYQGPPPAQAVDDIAGMLAGMVRAGPKAVDEQPQKADGTAAATTGERI